VKQNFSLLLKEKSLSLTAVRLALLEALDEAPHSEAAKIYELVQQKIPSVTIQAVYNNLHVLTEAKIVREIKPMGQVSLYETRVGDNHHHVVCRSCSAVMDTDCLGCAPCLIPANNHGFQVDEAEVIFWGYCPRCQKSQTKTKENKK
jgi:Fur family ferric uptake transcriptional regulator